MTMPVESNSWRLAVSRWYARSWWFVAPWMVVLAGMHVWSHTAKRYFTGAMPQQFGLYFGHGDIGPMLAIMLVLLVSAIWLFGGILVGLSFLGEHRVDRRVVWRVLVLGIALGLPFFPARSTWDKLLVATVGPGKIGGQLLAHAAGRGDLAEMRRLLDLGVAVDAPNVARTTELNALGEAARSRRPDAVALLLQCGADPNRRGFYERPLVYAVRAGDVAMARLLVEHGADRCITIIRYTGNTRNEIRLQSLAGDQAMSALLSGCPAPPNAN